MKVMFHQRDKPIDTAAMKAAFSQVAWVEVNGPEDAAREIADTDVICVANSAYTPEFAKVVLDGARQLKWLHFTTSGIDIALANGEFPPGIIVTNSAGLRARNLADHAFAMLLFLARRLRAIEAARVERKWVREEVWHDIFGLEGLTLTIVGMGAIGQVAARRARAFDMRVLAVSREYRADDMVEKVYPREKINEALAEADVVLISTISDSETRGFIDADKFAAMKPTAYFINVARGDLVNEPDMIAALKSGAIAGAGLDVTDVEPLPPESELWGFDNVFIAPHCGGAGSRSEAPTLRVFTDNLALFLENETMRNLVDWEALAT